MTQSMFPSIPSGGCRVVAFDVNWYPVTVTDLDPAQTYARAVFQDATTQTFPTPDRAMWAADAAYRAMAHAIRQDRRGGRVLVYDVTSRIVLNGVSAAITADLNDPATLADTDWGLDGDHVLTINNASNGVLVGPERADPMEAQPMTDHPNALTVSTAIERLATEISGIDTMIGFIDALLKGAGVLRPESDPAPSGADAIDKLIPKALIIMSNDPPMLGTVKLRVQDLIILHDRLRRLHDRIAL